MRLALTKQLRASQQGGTGMGEEWWGEGRGYASGQDESSTTGCRRKNGGWMAAVKGDAV